MEQRREVYFSGHVQGVGFRYTTRNIAGRHGVVGCVRNLPDGRVHVIVEGEASAVDAFVNDVAETMKQYLRDVTSTNLAPTGEFTDFSIGF